MAVPSPGQHRGRLSPTRNLEGTLLTSDTGEKTFYKLSYSSSSLQRSKGLAKTMLWNKPDWNLWSSRPIQAGEGWNLEARLSLEWELFTQTGLLHCNLNTWKHEQFLHLTPCSEPISRCISSPGLTHKSLDSRDTSRNTTQAILCL